MKWTENQQKAIELRDKNILVSAAAGSGKTAVLVERIKDLLISDKVPIDEMLIVTFSNAAASEMREKIIKTLSKEITEGKAENEKFARIQLGKIHRANISTFHAFSMEVIKRYFHLINIEPNFKICDDAQKSILRGKALDNLFNSLFESEDEDFLWFLREYANSKNENDVKNMIIEAHDFIQSIPDSFDWLERSAENLNCSKEDFYKSKAFFEIRQNIRIELEQCKLYFEGVYDLLSEAGISSLIPKLNLEIFAIDEVIATFAEADNDNDKFEKALQLLGSVKFQVYKASTAEKSDYEEVKNGVSALRDQGKSLIKKLAQRYSVRSMDEYVTELNSTYRGAVYLVKLVKKFDEYYKAGKEEKGLLDFNDIEHYGLEILKKEEAAAEYRKKFQYVFIDEYQDSNLVQETMINLIKRENNLFMVGDVKQSIYKFRLAEPEIFMRKYEEYKKKKNPFDEAVDLNMNFRSKGSIIDSVNHVFSAIMKKEITGLDYDKAAALYKGVDYEGELDYPVDLYIVDDKVSEDEKIDDEILEMKRAEVEAYYSAKIITESLGCKYFDAKIGKERELQKKDVVILLRAAKNTAEVYAKALSDAGIPSFVDMSDGYFDTMEIEVFLNLLRVIDNYKQDIPLISVLKSPIFGFTVTELAKIRIENRNSSYAKAFTNYGIDGKDEELANKCKNTKERILKWARESIFMSLEGFLWMLERETGYIDYVGALPLGQQRQANLQALIDKAILFQNSQGRGLFQFIQYIEAVKKEKVAMGQVKLLGENDDVVRIMTIHKSKGLEFPMVLVGGLGKRFMGANSKGIAAFHKDIGISLRFIDREKNIYKKTLFQMAIEEKKSKEDLAEEIRVLYVAFTRAMDKLVLLGSLPDMERRFESYELRKNRDVLIGNCYLDFLVPILEKTNITLHCTGRGQMMQVKEDDSEKTEILKRFLYDKQAGSANEKRKEIYDRLDFVYESEEKAVLKSKFSVSELNKMGKLDYEQTIDIPKLAVPLFRQEVHNFTEAEKGTILHTLMEHLNFKDFRNKENISEPYIRNCIDILVQREILLENESKTIPVRKVLKFFSSKIGVRAAKAEQIYREVSFNLLKDRDGMKIIVQGTIDCFFEEGDDFVLLDYKSSYLKANYEEEDLENLIDKYRGQLEIYKEALEKIKHRKVKETYLYLFSIDREVKIAL